MAVTERGLQRAVREAIGAHPDRVVLWRNNVGVAQHWDQRSGRVHSVAYGLAVGSGDLIGITNEGRFVSLELKAQSGRMRPEQVQWAANIRRMGGIAEVVRSEDDALRAVGLL